ncbi:hypothetical protein [Kushneria phosphatilytica]|uniref:hypothetical protein n=1 Tax=Kushneria phosphatilytica TaxID=657387 RepID=UPI0014387207|nr:hypothetical protein [Kushneria phosphatilytica]
MNRIGYAPQPSKACTRMHHQGARISQQKRPMAKQTIQTKCNSLFLNDFFENGTSAALDKPRKTTCSFDRLQQQQSPLEAAGPDDNNNNWAPLVYRILQLQQE